MKKSIEATIQGVSKALVERCDDLLQNWQRGTERPPILTDALPHLRSLADGARPTREGAEAILESALGDEHRFTQANPPLATLARSAQQLGQAAYKVAAGEGGGVARQLREASLLLTEVPVLAVPF